MTGPESISSVVCAPGGEGQFSADTGGGSAFACLDVSSGVPAMANTLQGVLLPDGLPAMIVGAVLLLLGLIRLKL